MIAENHETARDLARNLVRWFGPKRGLAWIDDRCLWFGIAPATYRVEREFYAWVRRYVREEIKRLDAADSHLGRTPVHGPKRPSGHRDRRADLAESAKRLPDGQREPKPEPFPN